METISNKINCLGTQSFELKFKGMRKFESFCVYPINGRTDKIYFQSGHRWAELNLENKTFEISASRSQYANIAWMQVCRMNKTTKSEQITDEQFNYIIAEIAKTLDVSNKSFVGQVMKELKTKFCNQYDSKVANNLISKLKK